VTSSTHLRRQVHPSFIQSGRHTSQTFLPTPKDEGNLSVYDGDQIEPEPAWQHYTGVLSLDSCGVVAVTVEECTTTDLSAKLDPEPFDEHAVIEFSVELTKKQVETKAKLLNRFATTRGWQHQA
jgi:hypothetical protein